MVATANNAIRVRICFCSICAPLLSLRDTAARNAPCTVADFLKTGTVAKNTQIPPRGSSLQCGWITSEEGRVLEEVFVSDAKQTIYRYWAGFPQHRSRSGAGLPCCARCVWLWRRATSAPQPRDALLGP